MLHSGKKSYIKSVLIFPEIYSPITIAQYSMSVCSHRTLSHLNLIFRKNLSSVICTIP